MDIDKTVEMFKAAKKKSGTTLTQFNLYLLMKLVFDASQYSIGVIVSQVMKGKSESLITFASVSLPAADENYT